MGKTLVVNHDARKHWQKLGTMSANGECPKSFLMIPLMAGKEMVGGISIQAHASSRTIATLGALGGKVKLHTHLQWKEDAVVLYGFATREELDMFKMLNTVTGVGPKLALAMLSNLSPEELGAAIVSDNVDLLTHIPGLGKKTAARIMLELKSKLEKGWGSLVSAYPKAGALDYCQVDACRLGGLNEVLAVLLLADKFGVPVCPHAGGLGLCEYVQHISILDYVVVSGSLEGRFTEYAAHLHEHFMEPVRVRGGRYLVPEAPGYSAEMRPESRAALAFTEGGEWRRA